MCVLLSMRKRHTGFKCDWSSDVWSSDLRVEHRVARDARAVVGQHHAAAFVLRGGLQVQPRHGGHVVGRLSLERTRRSEIGSASGRGRGEISVVAVEYKKKYNVISIVVYI